MDDLKRYFALLKKHRFWVACVLVLIVGFACWFKATGDVQASTKAQTANVESNFSSVKSVIGIANHPNDKWVEGKGKETEALKEKVSVLWNNLYSNQQDKICIWPEKGLSNDFREAIKELKPKDELPVVLLEEYQAHVKAELPKLCRILDASCVTDPKEGEGPKSGAAAGDRREKRETNHKVIWGNENDEGAAKKNQDDIYKSLDWPDRPNTTIVQLTQEDLWTYEAIFRAIAETNRDALGHYDAPVKVVQSVELGWDAAEDTPLGRGANRIERPKSAAAPGAPTTPLQGPTSPGALSIRPKRDAHFSSLRNAGAPPAAAPVGVAAPSGNQAATATSLKDWRYVDEKSRPLMAKDLEAGTLFEYRLLPFKLVVMVDQRKLSDLMKALAESPLPLEVREVRVNVHEKTSHQHGDAAAPDLKDTKVDNSDDLWFEIHGVAYWFNPPDPTKLNLAVAAAAPAAAPPGAPAPAAKTPATALPAATPPVATPPAATPPAGTPPVPSPAPAPPLPAGTPPAAPIAAPPAASSQPAVPAPGSPATVPAPGAPAPAPTVPAPPSPAAPPASGAPTSAAK